MNKQQVSCQALAKFYAYKRCDNMDAASDWLVKLLQSLDIEEVMTPEEFSELSSSVVG